jgi:hypothetical protein
MLEAALKEGLELVRSETAPWIMELLEGQKDASGKLVKAGLDLDHPRFSIKECRDFLKKEAVRRGAGMREATSSGAVGQLLRADTMRIMDGQYAEEKANLSYNTIPTQATSNKAGEFYNPLMTSVTQTETAEGAPFQQSGIKGINVVLMNKKFMGGESFTREAIDDDQTGQLRDRQRYLADAAIRTPEIYLALRYTGAGGTFGPLVVAADPWTTYATSRNEFDNTLAGIYTVRSGATGLGNRVTTFGQLSTSLLKEGAYLIRQQRDRQGTRMTLKADTLFISPTDEVAAAVLMGSQFWPMVQGFDSQTFNTASSAISPGASAMNPWRGAYKVVVNQYLTDWSWYLAVGGKGYVYQVRDAVEITMEQPNSGKSYDEDGTRLRTRCRWAQGWVDPRFACQGNDGTLVGTF